jgi:hypothetical protein
VVTVGGAQRQPVNFLELLDFLEPVRGKRRLAFKRMQADDWSEAISRLRVVQHQVPEFRNTYVLLSICQRKAAARILIQEHRIYPAAVRIVLDGKWTVEGRRFIVTATEPKSS